jgi:hypothetical protein
MLASISDPQTLCLIAAKHDSELVCSFVTAGVDLAAWGPLAILLTLQSAALADGLAWSAACLAP